MIRRVSLLLLALLLAAGLAAPAMAQDGNGAIAGQLVNGTPGGGNVAGQKAIMVTYLNDAPLEPTAVTQTDADGRFAFSGLATGPEYSYNVLATFEGVEYFSDLPAGERLSFGAGETALDITIPVYDSSTDNTRILVMLSHVIVYDQEDSVLVREYYVVVNSDNRTFIGREGDPGVLRFSLPGDAAGFQLTYGPAAGEVVNVAGGFWDTRPVRPGGNEVGYGYTLGLESGQLDLSRPINYPAVRLDVLVPQGSLEVTGDQLVPDESMTISGSIFSHYSAEDLVPGQVLTILVGAPSSSSGGIWPWLLGGLIAVVIFGLVFVFWKKRPARAPVEKPAVPPEEQLLAELAALDDQFEAGELDEATHKKLRDDKKAALMQLMRTPRGE
jgi:hypothetical protein